MNIEVDEAKIPWTGDLEYELRVAAAYLNRVPSTKKLVLYLAEQASKK